MLSFKYIIFPFTLIILSQFIKVCIEYIKNKEISFARFVNGMGGMPSTHSALVSSLSTVICLDYGITSPIFAITFIFSLVIIYDAMGIRYESGKQAEAINKFTGSKLKEKIGHKPIEVLVGIFLGVLVTIILNIIIK